MSITVLAGRGLHAILTGQGGTDEYCCADVAGSQNDGSERPSFAQLGLLARVAAPGSAVLDGSRFVDAASGRPKAELAAAIENVLLDRPFQQQQQQQQQGGASAQPTESSSCWAARLLSFSQPALDPAVPSLQQLALVAASTRPLAFLSPPFVSLLAAAGPCLPPSASPAISVRVAALRGSSLLACTETAEAGPREAAQGLVQAARAAYAPAQRAPAQHVPATAPAVVPVDTTQRQQQHWCRLDFAEGGTQPGTSACSCPDPCYGVLWCSHCAAAARALAPAAAPAPAAAAGLAAAAPAAAPVVLDLDFLDQALGTLPAASLAVLLLQLALVTHSIPWVLRALDLDPSALFLSSLEGLPLATPPLPPPAGSQPAASVQAPAAVQQQQQQQQPQNPFQRLGQMLRGPGLAGPPQLAHIRHLVEPARAEADTSAAPAAHVAAPVLSWRRFAGAPAAGGCIADVAARALQPLAPERQWAAESLGGAAADYPVTAQQGLRVVGRQLPQLMSAVLDLHSAGLQELALRLLKNITVTLSNPSAWRCAASGWTAEELMVHSFATLWLRLSSETERQQLFMPDASLGDGAARPLALCQVWTPGFCQLVVALLGPWLGVGAISRQVEAWQEQAAREMAFQATQGLKPDSPQDWCLGLASQDQRALTAMQQEFIPPILELLREMRVDEDRAVSDGTLLRAVANQLVRELVQQPSRAAQSFAALVPDLQSVLLSVATSDLVSKLEAIQEPPSVVQPRQQAGRRSGRANNGWFQPPELVGAASGQIKLPQLEFTVGQLQWGQLVNVEQQWSLPPDAPPTVISRPFQLVSLRVKELLLGSNPRHQAWVALYLTLTYRSSRDFGWWLMWSWLNHSGFTSWLSEVLRVPGTSTCIKAALLMGVARFAEAASKLAQGKCSIPGEYAAAITEQLARGQGLAPSFLAWWHPLSPALVEDVEQMVGRLLSMHSEGADLSGLRSLRSALHLLNAVLCIRASLHEIQICQAAAQAALAHPAPGAAARQQQPPQQQQGQQGPESRLQRQQGEQAVSASSSNRPRKKKKRTALQINGPDGPALSMSAWGAPDIRRAAVAGKQVAVAGEQVVATGQLGATEGTTAAEAGGQQAAAAAAAAEANDQELPAPQLLAIAEQLRQLRLHGTAFERGAVRQLLVKGHGQGLHLEGAQGNQLLAGHQLLRLRDFFQLLQGYSGAAGSSSVLVLLRCSRCALQLLAATAQQGARPGGTTSLAAPQAQKEAVGVGRHGVATAAAARPPSRLWQKQDFSTPEDPADRIGDGPLLAFPTLLSQLSEALVAGLGPCWAAHLPQHDWPDHAAAAEGSAGGSVGGSRRSAEAQLDAELQLLGLGRLLLGTAPARNPASNEEQQHHNEAQAAQPAYGFTKVQLVALRNQIVAFKTLKRAAPDRAGLSAEVMSSIQVPPLVRAAAGGQAALQRGIVSPAALAAALAAAAAAAAAAARQGRLKESQTQRQAPSAAQQQAMGAGAGLGGLWAAGRNEVEAELLPVLPATLQVAEALSLVDTRSLDCWAYLLRPALLVARTMLELWQSSPAARQALLRSPATLAFLACPLLDVPLKRCYGASSLPELSTLSMLLLESMVNSLQQGGYRTQEQRGAAVSHGEQRQQQPPKQQPQQQPQKQQQQGSSSREAAGEGLAAKRQRTERSPGCPAAAAAEPPGLLAHSKMVAEASQAQQSHEGRAGHVNPAGQAADGTHGREQGAQGDAGAPSFPGLLLRAVSNCQRWLQWQAYQRQQQQSAGLDSRPDSVDAEICRKEEEAARLLAAINVIGWWVERQQRQAGDTVNTTAGQWGEARYQQDSCGPSLELAPPTAAAAARALLGVLAIPGWRESVHLGACNALGCLAALDPAAIVQSPAFPVALQAALRAPSAHTGLAGAAKQQLVQVMEGVRQQLSAASPVWRAVLDRLWAGAGEEGGPVLLLPRPAEELYGARSEARGGLWAAPVRQRPAEEEYDFGDFELYGVGDDDGAALHRALSYSEGWWRAVQARPDWPGMLDDDNDD